jgi:hypothetical protein
MMLGACVLGQAVTSGHPSPSQRQVARMAWRVISEGMGADHLHRATTLISIWRSSHSIPPRAGRRISFFLKALCENPFSTNRTIELMDCKHNEGTGLSDRFFLIPRSTFVSYYYFLNQERAEDHFIVLHPKKQRSSFCVLVDVRTKTRLVGVLFDITESSQLYRNIQHFYSMRNFSLLLFLK